MEKTIWKRATTPCFWQGYVRWYQQWMAHSHYHDGIVNTITSMARPTWRVLDIGAGNGVLSRPLARMGCEVTALEPSPAMRDLLGREARADRCDGMHIDERRWETVRCEAFRDYDLILACNTLHLTQIGFAPALAKVFAAEPKSVLVVTEFFSSEIRIPDLGITAWCMPGSTRQEAPLPIIAGMRPWSIGPQTPAVVLMPGKK